MQVLAPSARPPTRPPASPMAHAHSILPSHPCYTIMDAMDLEDPVPELVLRPGDWHGPPDARSFRLLHERVASLTHFRVRFADTAATAVLDVIEPGKARRMGPWATFGPETYRHTASSSSSSTPNVAVDAFVSDGRGAVDTLCEPTCPMRMPGPTAMCRDCWHALIVDYGTLLADVELVRQAVATSTVAINDVGLALVAAWQHHPLLRADANGRARLRAVRLWYAATLLLGDPGSWEAWCAREFLTVALLSPALYGPMLPLKDADAIAIPTARWFAAVAEACEHLGTRFNGASLFFQTTPPGGGHGVALRGGTTGDAMRLVWRPVHHAAWCRELLTALSAAPTTVVADMLRVTERAPADVMALLTTREGDADRALSCAHGWREGLGPQSQQWLVAAAKWLGLSARPDHDDTSGHAGSTHWRARLPSLEALRPLLPPCLATVVEHGRHRGALKNSDRFYTANYLAALGQRDVKETRAFLVGNAATVVADIEDVIGPPRRGRKPPKPYLKSCERIRRETRDARLRPPPGNVMACPFETCAGCGMKARLPVRLGTDFDTPLGFLMVKLNMAYPPPPPPPPTMDG